MYGYDSNIPINDKSKEFDYELTDRKFYVGFGARFLSLLIDAFILAIPNYLLKFFYFNTKLQYVLIFLSLFLFNTLYQIYLPKKYGGTLGKLILKIKIVKLNGDKIGWKESILRSLIEFSIRFFKLMVLIYCCLILDNHLFTSVANTDNNFTDFLEPNIKLLLQYLSLIWTISELVVIFFNNKKRALQDYLAGTVVIFKKYQDEYMRINKNIKNTL